MLTKKEEVNSQRSRKVLNDEEDLLMDKLDKTQESVRSRRALKSKRSQRKKPDRTVSSSPNFRIDKEKVSSERSEYKPRKTIFLSSYSRRVKYKKREVDEEAVNIDEDLVKNDRTLRDEDWFLEKIEKCKSKRLQRICVCPLTRCFRLTDSIDAMKGQWQRVKRVFVIACCPPCCCMVQKSAFWPPRREYYFFKPPPDDIIIEIDNEADAIRMKERKKKLKKVKRARNLVIGDRYRFGLSHPCADDVKYVEGFAVKTLRKNRIGCIYIPCPEGIRPRFTLLYSHPNGSDLSDHLIGVPSLIDLARFYRCEVYSYDYSGYGISGGTASEANLYADIRAVYEYITVEKNVDPTKIVLLGYSIGSAATVELLRHEQERKPAGAILQSPPTSMLRVIGHMVGRKNHLEKPTCCIDRFVTIDKIHEVQIPILIIHGKEDKTVPIAHGELLCQRAVTKVPPEWVPEAAHDNIENCKEVWRRIRQFVKKDLNLGKGPENEKDKDKETTKTL